MIEALQRTGRAHDVLVVGHEANHITVPLLRAGNMDFVIAQNPSRLLDTAVKLASNPHRTLKEMMLLDFGIHTLWNVPSFAETAAL